MAKINLSRLNEILEKQIGVIFHIGIDVHKRSYHVALYGNTGQSYTFVCSASPQEVVKQFAQYRDKIIQIVYESGPTGFELARVLKESGFNVLVVAPSRIPRPVIAGAKTDRLDCIQLAKYSAHGMLKGIAIPTRAQEAQRSMIRRRHDLADSIRTVKQRIRSHLLYLSVKEPGGLNCWSEKTVKELLKLEMQPWAKDTIKSLIRELMFLKKEKQRIEEKIKKICNRFSDNKTFEFLQTIPGIGPITAATFQLELFDPARFKNSNQVASYVGLAPMVRQSGENKGRATLKPVGQKRLRSLLIEAAWCWCRKDEQAGAKYRRLVYKTNIPQKAIVAVARDLAVMLWKLSVEQRCYQLRRLEV
jgi:transposase